MTLIIHSAQGQSGANPLPRRGYFGVGLEANDAGVRIFAVSPDSTAAAFGIAVGDILEAVDARPLLHRKPRSLRSGVTRVERR
jgi:S1-C subfamily serine protease